MHTFYTASSSAVLVSAPTKTHCHYLLVWADTRTADECNRAVAISQGADLISLRANPTVGNSASLMLRRRKLAISVGCGRWVTGGDCHVICLASLKFGYPFCSYEQ